MKWIANILGGLFGTTKNLSDPKQYDIKREKRHLYRIESAMNYIFVDEKSGRYKKISNKKQAELKEHFRKRVFDVS